MSNNIYKHGYVFIINQPEGRAGSNMDRKLLKTTFESINATVTDWSNDNQDLNGNDVKKKMDELLTTEWRMKFKECEYVAMVYLSHGSNDEMVNIKGGVMPVRSVLLARLHKIAELEGKLKWLIVQACRGNATCLKTNTDGRPGYGNTRYYYISFASQEGTIAFRRDTDEEPSIFIENLCNELKLGAANNCYITEIMDKTREKVEQFFLEAEEALVFQIPAANENFGTWNFSFKNE